MEQETPYIFPLSPYATIHSPSGTLLLQLFNDGGCCHIKTSPLICSANQWTGFYMVTASVMKELIVRT